MPAVPLEASASHPTQVRPRDPNVSARHDSQSHSLQKSPSHQPSPGVIDTASHTALHVQPRRYLGSLPAASDVRALTANRSRLHRARVKALERIQHVVENSTGLGSHAEGAFQGESEGRVREGLSKIKVLRLIGGVRVEEELEIDEPEQQGEGSRIGGWWSGMGLTKGKTKEKWEGESFDIGREFFVLRRTPSRERNEEVSVTSSLFKGGVFERGQSTEEPSLTDRGSSKSGQPDRLHSAIELDPPDRPDAGSSEGASVRDRTDSDSTIKPTRPNLTARSTQESFVTARTEFTTSPSSAHIHLPEDQLSPGMGIGQSPQASNSGTSLRERDGNRSSDAWSMISPLIDSNPAAPADPSTAKRTDNALPDRNRRLDRLRRLKSAIRKPSSTITTPAELPSGGGSAPFHPIKQDNQRSKSVSFPVNPVSLVDGKSIPGSASGNRPPEDPDAVLARQGEDAEGTSAGAQETALDDLAEEDEDDDEDEKGLEVGDAVLRGGWIDWHL